MQSLDAPKLQSLDPTEAWGEWALEGLRSMGHEMHEPSLVTALPPGMPFEAFGRRRAPVTRRVDAGGVIGLGDWCFEVLHLPGHSPGSIGSWEAMTGTLFSGDAIDDGPLLDELDGSKADDDCATMERPLTLPVSVVHGGHDPSFGRERLREIATDDLQRRRG